MPNNYDISPQGLMREVIRALIDHFLYSLKLRLQKSSYIINISQISTQFPRLQEVLPLGLTGRNVIEKSSKICVLVTPRIFLVDESGIRFNHALEGKTVQRSNGDTTLC